MSPVFEGKSTDRYYNLIYDEIEYIVKDFDMAREMGGIRKFYRFSKIKSHVIFFKTTKNNEIEVVRVLHERMNIENRLAE